jgi:protein phosphatase
VVETIYYINKNMAAPANLESQSLSLGVFVGKDEHKETNEDSVVIILCSQDKLVMAIADGLGGHPQGDVASQIAVAELGKRIQDAGLKDSYRSEIIDTFERANQKILDLKSGAGTTLIVIEIHGQALRVYHAGDSSLVIFGGKGRQRYRTIGHSLFDLGQEAGLVDESNHNDGDLRSTVTNLLGCDHMRVEIGPTITLAPRDIVVMGSDGLFDNLSLEEIKDQLKGSSLDVCQKLAFAAKSRMIEELPKVYSKPDDLSLIVLKSAKNLTKTKEIPESNH